ncbi:MAG TPA: glycosyltransferase, partial [Candidatus Wujingus californicus]
NYVNFAFDGIFSFSTFPLKVFLWLGVVVAFFCLLYAGFYSVIGLMNYFYASKNLLPPGWATITVSILFLGAVQLIGIGCLGEYIGRIYSQTKERPDFIVKEKRLE